jgi:hypothetical protein
MRIIASPMSFTTDILDVIGNDVFYRRHNRASATFNLNESAISSLEPLETIQMEIGET